MIIHKNEIYFPNDPCQLGCFGMVVDTIFPPFSNISLDATSFDLVYNVFYGP
jgi:hypothetical protein